MADDGALLRHKFTKGKDQVYANTMKTTQGQKFGGMTIDTVMDQSQVTRVMVDEVDSKGNATLRVKSEQMQMKMDVKPFLNYEFDSKKADNDKSSQAGAALTPVLERLVGTEINVELDPVGTILKAKGQLDQIKELLNANPVAAQFLAGMTDEKATAATLQDQYAKFPEKGVKVGDTWETEENIDLGLGKSKLKKKYTVEAADKVGDRKTLRIKTSVTGNIEIDVNQGGQKVSGTLSVTNSDGILQFDPEAGQTVTQTSQMEVSGQLQVDVNGQSLMVETTQKQETSRKLLDKLP